MSKIISETFYGSREPQWLVESPKEVHSHYDCRGCVRQIRSNNIPQTVHTPPLGRTHQENEDAPLRSSYYPMEQPSMVKNAYVHNAVPRTVDRPALSTLNIPIVEFMVPLCCVKCEEKVREELENVEGVYKVVCDHHTQRVTVSSSVDPQRLLKRVKRVKKNAHFWRGSSSYRRNVPSDHVHRSDTISAYKLDQSAPHRGTPREHQRYPVSVPGPSYDEVPLETQYYGKRKLSRGPQAQDHCPQVQYYYGGEEQVQLHKSAESPFTAGTPYIVNPMETSDSLHYGRLPSSYGPAYQYSQNYALSSPEYY